MRLVRALLSIHSSGSGFSQFGDLGLSVGGSSFSTCGGFFGLMEFPAENHALCSLHRLELRMHGCSGQGAQALHHVR